MNHGFQAVRALRNRRIRCSRYTKDCSANRNNVGHDWVVGISRALGQEQEFPHFPIEVA